MLQYSNTLFIPVGKLTTFKIFRPNMYIQARRRFGVRVPLEKLGLRVIYKGSMATGIDELLNALTCRATQHNDSTQMLHSFHSIYETCGQRSLKTAWLSDSSCGKKNDTTMKSWRPMSLIQKFLQLQTVLKVQDKRPLRNNQWTAENNEKLKSTEHRSAEWHPWMLNYSNLPVLAVTFYSGNHKGID